MFLPGTVILGLLRRNKCTGGILTTFLFLWSNIMTKETYRRYSLFGFMVEGESVMAGEAWQQAAGVGS